MMTRAEQMEVVQNALRAIPSDDRDVWIMVGMALKDGFKDEGLQLWDDWSRTSGKYDPTVLRQQWESFAYEKPGGVTMGSLFHAARQHGWNFDKRPVGPLTERTADRLARLEAERIHNARAQRAKNQAVQILARCEWSGHPYLAAKGFPDRKGLVAAEGPDEPITSRAGNRLDVKGRLVLPIRDADDALMSLQLIDGDGGKLFLPGGRVRGGAFVFGSDVGRTKGRESWLCEGFATGLSVRAALHRLYRSAEVVVCFSAANMARVHLERQSNRKTFAAADADDAGRRTAKAASLRTWSPPVDGQDANDMMRAQGLDALVSSLREFLVEAGEVQST